MGTNTNSYPLFVVCMEAASEGLLLPPRVSNHFHIAQNSKPGGNLTVLAHICLFGANVVYTRQVQHEYGSRRLHSTERSGNLVAGQAVSVEQTRVRPANRPWRCPGTKLSPFKNYYISALEFSNSVNSINSIAAKYIYTCVRSCYIVV